MVVGLPIPIRPSSHLFPTHRARNVTANHERKPSLYAHSTLIPSSSFLFHIISCMHIPIVPSHQTQQQTHRHVTDLSRFLQNSKRETHHTNSRTTNHESHIRSHKITKSRGSIDRSSRVIHRRRQSFRSRRPNLDCWTRQVHLGPG